MSADFEPGMKLGPVASGGLLALIPAGLPLMMGPWCFSTCTRKLAIIGFKFRGFSSTISKPSWILAFTAPCTESSNYSRSDSNNWRSGISCPLCVGPVGAFSTGLLSWSANSSFRFKYFSTVCFLALPRTGANIFEFQN